MNEIDWIQTSENLLRKLTIEEEEILKKQECINEFKRQKLELEAQKNWDMFYNRNSDNFFKDRHWMKCDFETLLNGIDLNKNLSFMEAGCGVGNMLFPLSSYYPQWKLLGIDFSKHAINIVNKRASNLNISIETAIFDLTADETKNLELNFFPKADILSLIFVLSAISPTKHERVIINLKKFLNVGSSVIIRDYGELDYAMLRFGRGRKISNRFYKRQDGTMAYFFAKEELKDLFIKNGFEMQRCEYLYKKTVNLKKKLSVDRVFVQARFSLKNKL